MDDARNKKIYDKPAYAKTDLKGDPSVDGKVTWRMTEEGGNC
jgi:hypothetical protein